MSVIIIPVQVHACNILRALYRETKLGEDVFPFVSDGVAVAITGFHSDSWAVSRQCIGRFSYDVEMITRETKLKEQTNWKEAI